MSQMSQSKRQAKYHGLVNQGATCYLNSVLQVLFMTKDFRERVAKHTSFTSHSHMKNHADKGHIEIELGKLFSALEKSHADTHLIRKKLKINNVYEPHDAAEHYEKILRMTSPEASQIFHGELINSNICKKCQNATESPAGFWSLPLPLVNDNNEYSVEKGIDDFFRSSEISGDDQMYCENCDKKCDAILDCKVKRYPDVLVLLLKRFELIFDGKVWKKVKINCLVKIPDILQMEQTYKYELYAYVEHFGDLQSGHYTARIKSQDDGVWYFFDDSKVKVSEYIHFQLDRTETSRSVYLLFYQRQKDTTLTNMERHHSSEEKERKVSPASKRTAKRGRLRGENVNIDSNDDQNEEKRRKTNRKDVLGQGECHKRSQVPEDTREDKGLNVYLVKQSKPNVEKPYRDSRDVNVESKMLVYRQHNGGRWEDQGMAMRQEFKEPQSAECWQQDVQDRDRPHMQVNGSIGCTPNQNEMQCELNKRQQSKQIEYSLYEHNRLKARQDKHHVNQHRHERYRHIKHSDSCAPSEYDNTNRNHHVHPYWRIPNGRRQGSSARFNNDSFHGHTQNYSQDIQLEKLGKEIQVDKMKNERLRKKAGAYYKEPPMQKPSPQRCLEKLQSKRPQSSYRQNPQTAHLQKPKDISDYDNRKGRGGDAEPMAKRQQLNHPQSAEYRQQDVQLCEDRGRPHTQVKHNNSCALSHNKMNMNRNQYVPCLSNPNEKRRGFSDGFNDDNLHGSHTQETSPQRCLERLDKHQSKRPQSSSRQNPQTSNLQKPKDRSDYDNRKGRGGDTETKLMSNKSNLQNAKKSNSFRNKSHHNNTNHREITSEHLVLTPNKEIEPKTNHRQSRKKTWFLACFCLPVKSKRKRTK